MIGKRLGEYEVVSRLGAGAAGTVYLGVRADGAKAALKVLHPHLVEEPGYFRRFEREASVGLLVDDEHVVSVLDYEMQFVDGRPVCVVAMEYVEGRTLRALLDELGQVPEALLREIASQIALGLHAIHAQGIIHRDIKPDNILITDDQRIRIMDLGVAKVPDASLELTHQGGFAGTLSYAAPEQLRGQDVAPSADLYALGVLLYELATGDNPFRHEDVAATISAHMNLSVPQASERTEDVSPFLSELVATLLAKDRKQRFGAAADLAAVLEEGETSGWWKARAKALRIQTKHGLRRIRIPRDTAIYGRNDDLARFHALYEKAKAGDGQVLLIEGEAGIGKTRLVDEFVGQLRQEGEDLHFLFGSYPPGGAATTSGAFSEAYREQFGAEDLEETLQGYLTVTPLLVPAFAALLKGDAPPKDAEPLTKDSLQSVFVHATRALAAERPTIVLTDDLHFAPEEGRALFSSLAMAVPDHRILLIGTMRPSVPEEWTAEITRLGHAEQRSLARLGPKDLIRLLNDTFRSERLANELGARIALKCDGNPFFAFEIIRGLREGQFIAQQPDGSWATTKVIQNIQVPSSILDLVNARVADLTQEERDLLDVASCCGYEFDPGIVATVVGEAVLPTLKRFAGIEKRHRLVRAAGRHLVFDHHQVQEALYSSLYVQMRESYHAAIAEALETRAGAAENDPKNLGGALCVDLCEHNLKGAQGKRALRYLDAALGHLKAGYIHEPAIALADHVLETPGLVEGARRVGILMGKSERLDMLARRQVQEAVLQEAAALAEAEDDEALRAKVASARGRLFLRTGRQQDALEHLERALASHREVGDRQGEALAAQGLGLVLCSLDRYDEGRGHFERALAIAREVGDRRGEATSTQNLGLVCASIGRHDEGRRHFERARAIARDLGDWNSEVAPTANLGRVLSDLGRHDEAREHLERALDLSRQVGDRYAEAHIAGNMGFTCLKEGLSAEALELLERAHDLSRDVGDREAEARNKGNLGRVLASLGRLVEGKDHQERYLDLARDIGYRHGESWALDALGALAAEQGNLAEAERCFQEALRIRRSLSDPAEEAESLLALAALHVDAGRTDKARAVAHAALEIARERSFLEIEARALARLVALRDESAAEVIALLTKHQAALRGPTAIEAWFLVWQTSQDPTHLQQAKCLLDDRVEHAPEEYRESMLNNVKLNREIMEAWEANQ